MPSAWISQVQLRLGLTRDARFAARIFDGALILVGRLLVVGLNRPSEFQALFARSA
jgi:hypothetical protein